MKLSLITATRERANTLASCALPSVLMQTDCQFEWIVINDGADPQTRELVGRYSHANCSVVYLEMEHPPAGFGLCYARNLGLSTATGEIVSYLDDDNAIAPTFVAETKAFHRQHPDIRCSLAVQHRRRDITRSGQVIKQGTPFISPCATSTVRDLIQQKTLFDSNGFTHDRNQAPEWNPSYRVFADYDYFLRCLLQWGRHCFCIHPSVLVDYVQTSEGVIGQSSYGEWAGELSRLLHQSSHSLLTETDVQVLTDLALKWQDKQSHKELIPAFVV